MKSIRRAYDTIELSIFLIHKLLQRLPVIPLRHIRMVEITLQFRCGRFPEILDKVCDDDLMNIDINKTRNELIPWERQSPLLTFAPSSKNF